TKNPNLGNPQCHDHRVKAQAALIAFEVLPTTVTKNPNLGNPQCHDHRVKAQAALIAFE
ncbi:13502_t:CDS:2, partial [Entrophospora sp. SA101]